MFVGADPDTCGMIYPEDGSSNVPDGFAMVANCPNPDMAALLMDFLVSAECQQVMSDEFGRRTVRDDIAQPAALPNLDDIYFINYDFQWAGAGKAERRVPLGRDRRQRDFRRLRKRQNGIGLIHKAGASASAGRLPDIR